MLIKTEKQIYNDDRCKEIITKIGPDVLKIFQELKTELGGKLPAELSYGIVAGFLRGKGYSWEECFIGMERFISVTNQLLGEPNPPVQAVFSIMGKEDGGVKLDFKEIK